MIVLDASAAVDFLLGISPQAERIAARLGHARETLHAPALIDAECLQTYRRRVLRRVLSAARARQALDALADLRLTRYPLPPLVPRMWALRANLSASDAAYVALAEALDAPLVTTDVKLGHGVGGLARVELFA